MEETVHPNCITYHIDDEDRIVFLSENWQTFADDNGASDLTPDNVLGRPLFDFIAGPESKHLYRLLLERCRREQVTISFPFRCDAPAKRRFMRMEIFPLEDKSTGFNSRLVMEEARKPVPLLGSHARRSDRTLRMCGWCKKIEVCESRWDEVEGAIDQLGLFGEQAMPRLTHGVCRGCRDEIHGRLH